MVQEIADGSPRSFKGGGERVRAFAYLFEMVGKESGSLCVCVWI